MKQHTKDITNASQEMLQKLEKEKRKGYRNIATVAAVVVLACLYLGGCLFFRNHFMPGTRINERKVGGYTAAHVKAEIAEEIHSYTLQIKEREGKEEQIKGVDIQLEPQLGNEIEDLLETQNTFAWPTRLFYKENIEHETLVDFDADELARKVDELDCMKTENQIAPEDATVSAYDKTQGYVLQPCVMGTTIDRDKLVSAVDTAVGQLMESLSIEKADAYINPVVYDDDAKLAEAIDTMNHFAKASITYEIGEQTQVLDASTFGAWITLDKDIKPVIRKKMVEEYVAGLAKTYNTCYSAKKLKTSYNKEVTIGMSHYGWKVDNDAETKQIINEIKKGEAVTRDLNYSMTANSHEGDDYGDSYVEINLTAQHLFLYKNGKLVIESDFVSGNLARGNGSPTGAYGITYTQRDATLRGQTYESHVDYWMPFAGNVGMHDAPWRSKFGGTIYKTNGSHGCINLPPSVAKVIFENVGTNYPVLVYELPGTENTTDEDKSAAEKVMKLIGDIGKVTADSGESIKKAQSAYDKLNDKAKAYVTNKNKLDKAHKDFEKIKDEKHKNE